MESKKYPIFATMYHPEYQVLDQIGPQKWKLPKDYATDEIAFRLSYTLNKFARKNSNRIAAQNRDFFDIYLRVESVPS